MYHVNKLFTDDKIKEFAETVATKLAIEDLYVCYKDILLTSGNIELKNSIPAAPSYYIPRRIYAKRIKLDTEVFRVACPDVFVFKSNQISQLSSLLNNQPLYHSSTQLVKVGAKFIRLIEDLDWPEIRTKSKSPVHLVKHKYVDGVHSCLLEETTAGSEIIRRFLRHENGRVHTIEEHEFIGTALQISGSGICICDKPGMGKSFLLASLARNVQERYPENIVTFIQLTPSPV